jgi:hypothetical protein
LTACSMIRAEIISDVRMNRRLMANTLVDN